jgi:hypothetical protein
MATKATQGDPRRRTLFNSISSHTSPATRELMTFHVYEARRISVITQMIDRFVMPSDLVLESER